MALILNMKIEFESREDIWMFLTRKIKLLKIENWNFYLFCGELSNIINSIKCQCVMEFQVWIAWWPRVCVLLGRFLL